MKTKRGSLGIRSELWVCGLAMALLFFAEAWLLGRFRRDCSATISVGECLPGVPVVNSFFAFN